MARQAPAILLSLLQLAVQRRAEVCEREAARVLPGGLRAATESLRARRSSVRARRWMAITCYVERLEAAYVSGDQQATLAVLQERWRS